MPDGKIFDTHAHYDDDAFDADRDVLLTALPSKGVGAAINAAIDPASARRCLAMCAVSAVSLLMETE